ncbi:MAG: hypothetical protein U9R50_01485 [Campylobacterota bacterium]|nr:hypothetical protein [Campylobacterota bacterium]
MKKIIFGVMLALTFIACSDEEIVVEPKASVGKSLQSLELKDQFEQVKRINDDTKKVIFAFSKDMGHLSNDYFNTKEPTFLADHNTIFIADVSNAPSLIRSMFIMPGLKDFKHTVLVIDDEMVAASYRNKGKEEQLMVVSVDNFTIKSINYISTETELAKEF